MPMQAFAEVEPAVPPSALAQEKITARQALDTPAQRAMRKAASDAAKPIRLAEAEISHPDLVARLEEIRVYARNEPEEYQRPKLAPMLQFRARLEKDVPLSPAKRLQAALCLIGLCAIDQTTEPSPETRAEMRLQQSTLDSIRQGRGTLQ